jgi:hypothetical protein
MDYSSQVVTCDALHASDLQNRFDHTISALHIPHFYPNTLANALGRVGQPIYTRHQLERQHILKRLAYK